MPNSLSQRMILKIISMIFFVIIAVNSPFGKIDSAKAATLLPNGEQVFLNNDGTPLAGGSVMTYIPGTTVQKNTWQDSGQTTLNTNPIILDSAGRAVIYGSGSYREVVKDQNGNLIWDQVTADTSATSSSWGGTSGGTANAQTVSAPNFTNADGQSISFIAGFTNTGPMSLNPNGAGPINVLKDTASGPVSLTGGEVVAGTQVTVVYDSNAGAFHLVTFPNNISAPVSTLASATTTNLGSAPTRNINITGTTTITSFGSSASTTLPYFNVTFAGSLTLTNSASLALPTGQNILTSAGDYALALYLGSGNWQVVSYQKVSGFALSTALVPVRQTVLSGPQTGNAPAFLPATSGTLSITSQNLSSSIPLVVASANGFGTNGSLDLVGATTTNLTWSGLTASTTNYLGVTVGQFGTLTTLMTTTAPIYQFGGTISVANGQYTFDILQMKMFLGNGASAAKVNVVFVGEAVTGVSTVTSTVAYAYQGYFDSGFTNTLPAAATNISAAANIGVVPQDVYVVVQNLVAEGNYSVGDQIIRSILTSYSGANVAPLTTGATRNTVWFTTGSSTPMFWLNKTTGIGLAPPTAADWAYKIIARRGW